MSTLDHERQHLAGLLEAVQRSSWFLHQSASKINWPMTAETLESNRKDVQFFETLAAVNERFATLQDTLASAMRHSALLLSEPAEHFLKVLAYFEKCGVLESVETWQESRMVRNMAAHDYETDYELIAEHFNALHTLMPMLLRTSYNLVQHADNTLSVRPRSNEFAKEFAQLFS